MSRGMKQLKRLNRAAEIFESVKEGSVELYAEHDIIYITSHKLPELTVAHRRELQELSVYWDSEGGAWSMYV